MDWATQKKYLAATIERLENDPTFDNSKLFCLNARFGWGHQHSAWSAARDRQDSLDGLLVELESYIELMEQGRKLLESVNPDTLEKQFLLSRYQRSCLERWDWARLLRSTRDLNRVNLAIDAYRVYLGMSDDPED